MKRNQKSQIEVQNDLFPKPLIVKPPRTVCTLARHVHFHIVNAKHEQKELAVTLLCHDKQTTNVRVTQARVPYTLAHKICVKTKGEAHIVYFKY